MHEQDVNRSTYSPSMLEGVAVGANRNPQPIQFGAEEVVSPILLQRTHTQHPDHSTEAYEVSL